MCSVSLKEAWSNLYTNPEKKNVRISFHHMDTTAREFLTKGVVGVKKKIKRKKIYRNAEKYSRERKENTQTKSKQTQRHLSEPCSFYGFINMNKHCPVCMNKKNNVSGFFLLKVFGPRTHVPLWCRGLTVDMSDHNGRHRGNMLEPTKGRGGGLTWPSCVTRGLREMTCNSFIIHQIPSPAK